MNSATANLRYTHLNKSIHFLVIFPNQMLLKDVLSCKIFVTNAFQTAGLSGKLEKFCICLYAGPVAPELGTTDPGKKGRGQRGIASSYSDNIGQQYFYDS